VILASLALVPAVLWAAEVRVAVASNFLLPLKSLAPQYQQASGDTLRISAGSTGKLTAQIINGAPFDVFLSANSREPKRLKEQGLGVAGSRFTYALGQLVLWAPQMKSQHEDMLTTLRGGRFRRLSLANPRTDPYGAAAMEVLERLGLKTQLQAKIIRSDNVSQAYQYVATGAAEMGFVALSQIQVHGAEGQGHYWTVDTSLYAPIRQQALLLKTGEGNAAARRFLQYLRSAAGREAIKSFGYGVTSL